MPFVMFIFLFAENLRLLGGNMSGDMRACSRVGVVLFYYAKLLISLRLNKFYVCFFCFQNDVSFVLWDVRPGILCRAVGFALSVLWIFGSLLQNMTFLSQFSSGKTENVPVFCWILFCLSLSKMPKTNTSDFCGVCRNMMLCCWYIKD